MRSCLNLKCGNAVALIFLFPFIALGQVPDSTKSRKEDNSKYLFPITPGVTNTLAGTMGELRSTHFHSGLDVRTNNMVGAAVIASMDGYIVRAVRSSYSYGNVIFIKHPDGNTTLYAHLNEFRGKFAEHVRQQQYNQKIFEIDLRFETNQFPVNRGDTIAFSGNTGSSNGPHLHYDIRDHEMNALNPLDFGFDEVIDKTRPIVQKIAFKTMDADSRINGRFGRFEFNVLKVGKDYVLPKPILATGRIGVELLAHDKMDNSRFSYGINTITMNADSQQVFKQFIGKINMKVTRGIVSLFDYAAFRSSGHRYNKLFIDDGNPQDFYIGTINKGVISVDKKDVPVLIELKDFNQNSTNVKFTLKNDPLTKRNPFLSTIANNGYVIDGNYMIISSKVCKDTTVVLYNSKSTIIDQSYFGPGGRVFIHDLRKSVPDSIKVCNEIIKTGIADVVPSPNEYTYYNDYASVFFPDSALFDTLYFSISNKMLDNGKEILTIGDPTVPLMKDIRVEWVPKNSYDTSKYSVYRVGGDSRNINIGRKWRNGKVVFETREFGRYTLLKDTIPPAIRLINCNKVSARFKITDELSGIYSFSATINGQWLLMNYDYKTGILFSEKLDRDIPLKGDFELSVTDYSGNVKTYKQKIL